VYLGRVVAALERGYNATQVHHIERMAAA
jgi:hypothetical protein